MATVLIADDNRSLRTALRYMLDCEPDLQVIGEAADGDKALKLAFELKPDILLADISMPGLDGIELASALRARLPAVRVLIVSLHEDSALVMEALRAGAAAYVTKRTLAATLVPAIRGVLHGDAPPAQIH